MTTQTIVPYDENLLERARTQWQFGDWQSLLALDRAALQHHPDRAKLALLAAAAHLQTDTTDTARPWLRLARDWGCNPKLIHRILLSGVHNTLARAAALNHQTDRAQLHFQKSIETGSPGSATRLLVQARMQQQLQQIGVDSPKAVTFHLHTHKN